MIERLHGTNVRSSALVLAPTRELASQIVDDLRGMDHARALSIAAVYGGAGIVKQARLAARAHILVATPGRLLDLIDRRDVSLDRVKLLGARRGRQDARHGLRAHHQPDREDVGARQHQTLSVQRLALARTSSRSVRRRA